MPSDHDVTRCPSCGARIRWAVTAAGRRQPIDAEPDETGNLGVYRDVAGRLRSRVLTAERPTLEHAEWRAMPHAANCPSPAPRSRRSPGGQRHRTGVRPVPWQGQR
ncbi:hypothetical protein [Streptomyces thermolilacinus]|uniref:hypothetical protein n=1 Tax=Streptomyces thermolilacinus TaxID=285540 RepID=UPI0033F9F0C0